MKRSCRSIVKYTAWLHCLWRTKREFPAEFEDFAAVRKKYRARNTQGPAYQAKGQGVPNTITPVVYGQRRKGGK